MLLPDTISAYGIELVLLTGDDIEKVRQWRNHPDVARYMFSQDYITTEQQKAWFEKTAQSDNSRHYLIIQSGQKEGVASVSANGALDGADELEAAIYFAPESRLRGNLFAFAPALALNDACFSLPACNRLLARVKQENTAAIRFNNAMGYQIEKNEGKVVYMVMTLADYDQGARKIKALLQRRNG